MKVRIEVAYHPEYADFEPYVARVLDYPNLQGYGHTSAEAIQDAKTFLVEHLGHELHILKEEVLLELAG